MSIPSSRDDVATRHGSWPGLQQLLDDRALLVGERAVVGAGNFLDGVRAGGSCHGRGPPTPSGR